MLDSFDEAAHHPDMTEDLAEVLSTPTVELTRQVKTEVNIKTS